MFWKKRRGNAEEDEFSDNEIVIRFLEDIAPAETEKHVLEVVEVKSTQEPEEPAEVVEEIVAVEEPAAVAEEAVAVEEPAAIEETTVDRYDRSFTAKLIQANDEVRGYYNALKNEFSRYGGVSSRIGWQHESVKCAKIKVARLSLKAKAVYLYLPLDPDDYAESKYKVERVEAKKFEDYPCLFKISGVRRAKYAADLIADVMSKFGIERVEREEKDFLAAYPYEDTESLIEKGLIKLTKGKKSSTRKE